MLRDLAAATATGSAERIPVDRLIPILAECAVVYKIPFTRVLRINPESTKLIGLTFSVNEIAGAFKGLQGPEACAAVKNAGLLLHPPIRLVLPLRAALRVKVFSTVWELGKVLSIRTAPESNVMPAGLVCEITSRPLKVEPIQGFGKNRLARKSSA